jgi:hypothetical protein
VGRRHASLGIDLMGTPHRLQEETHHHCGSAIHPAVLAIAAQRTPKPSARYALAVSLTVVGLIVGVPLFAFGLMLVGRSLF